CSYSRLTSGTWSFYQDFYFLQAMPHRLPRRVLRNHLRSVSSALARTFEAHFAGARPSNDIAFQVGNRHDCVVKGRKYMGNAGINILTAFGFDNFGLVNFLT